MADTKMQEAAQASQQSAQQTTLKPSTSEVLAKYGGFSAVKGFIPTVSDMDPSKKVTRAVFLAEKKHQSKREALAKELRGWIELLEMDKNNSKEYKEACSETEKECEKVMSRNITEALKTTKQLETAYRALDSFFKSANDDKLSKLHICNVKVVREEDIDISGPEEYESKHQHADESLRQQVNKLLKDAYDQLDLQDNYSLLVLPSYEMHDKPTLLEWAKIAHKYKVMLITDHKKENSVEDLLLNTAEYKDSDIEFSNVIMTANWIVGRSKEQLSDYERESDDKAFYIPASAALAGKLYDESANMGQGAAGKKYGTLNEMKDVNLALHKSEITKLMNNCVVPVIYYKDRVVAWENCTLFSGENKDLKEYPIVRVYEWIKKVMMNYVHSVWGENASTTYLNKIKKACQDFLDMYKGEYYKKATVSTPIQNSNTLEIEFDINITPLHAAKNFTINVKGNKNSMDCKDSRTDN